MRWLVPTTWLLIAPTAAFAGSVSKAPIDETAAPVVAPQTPPAAKPVRRKRGRLGRLTGYAVAEGDLRSDPLPRASGDLFIFSPNWLEEVKVNIYNEDGSFNPDALRELSRLFRCKRTDTEKAIEPHLFELLSLIQDHFGGRRMEVVSGFRNQRKVSSFHFHGTAADIRIDGVPDKVVRDFAASLDTGGMGVGLYPRAHFVHVDVRPAPSFRWIDYSRSGDGNPGRLPPRGFKKKLNPES